MILTDVDGSTSTRESRSSACSTTLTLAEAARLDARSVRRGEHGAESSRRRGLRATHWRPRYYYRACARPRSGARRCRNERSSRRTREHSRVSGKGNSAAGRRADSTGRGRDDARAGRADRATVRRHGRGEGAGARGRARQGRRRQAREDAGRGGGGRAAKILGMQIKGLTVEKVLVTAAADIETEAYVGIIIDRASKRRCSW